jgi:hypothetical protein
MAQTLYPTAIVAKGGLGGLVTDIDDDPASPDANWCTSGSTSTYSGSGAGTLAASTGSGAGTSGESGEDYSGFTPTIYAATADIGSGDGSSEANAMDLPTALATATAGDIIGVLPGVYSPASTPSTDSWLPCWQPTNAGSSGSPIRIVAKYAAVHLTGLWSNSDRTELRNGYSGTVDGSGLSTFGSLNKDYIEWHGLCVDAAQSGPRTEKALVTMNGCTGVKIHKCEIRGATAQWSDNWSGVRYENCDECDVIDCRIYNFYDTGGSHSWGILMYGGENYEIAYNEIYDTYGGICPKGILGGYPQNSPGTIHHNLIHDVDVRHILVMGVNEDSVPGYVDVYQNVMYESGRFGISAAPPGADTPRSIRFVNNTIVDCGSASGDGGCYLKPYTGSGYDGCVLQNNIFASNYAGILTDGNDVNPFDVIDRNLYSSSSLVFNGSNFATFQATGRETNGTTGDPLFTNAGTRDYTLQAGSPALTLGRDLLSLNGTLNATIPAGAYITGTETIGVRS